MTYTLSYDNQSFMVDGKRLFLHSAAIHYFRFPRSEWREVLWKAKLAGINCVDTYFAWNVHEPHEGEWNFSGDADCDEFLSICEELELHVIARPGPYICAEWDFGGFPWWLNGKELKYRDFDANFLKYVDLYFDKIVPIIARHQSTKGGSVIMVQVENEYQHLASDQDGRDYLNHLRDGLTSRGIDVTLISCEGGVDGAIECANFWSGADRAYAKLRNKQPDTPKIVTEFWTGWFERWGGARADHKTPELLERRMMEVLRAGFTGLNHYMFCGGTNFGGYGGRTVDASDVYMVTSYDYHAPLNEYLGYTPKYNVAKKQGYFIQSIEDFLLISEEKEARVRMSREGVIRQRVSGDTSLYFVEHTSDERAAVHFTTEEGETFSVTVNPGQIAPVIAGHRLLPGWKLTYNSFLGGFHQVGGIPTLVVYADEGQRSLLRLVSELPIQAAAPASVQVKSSADSRTIELDLCHYAALQTIHLDNGDGQLRIIVLSSQAMDRVWWLEHLGAASLVIGAEGIRLEGGKPRLEVKSFQEQKVRWYGDRELFGADPHNEYGDGSYSLILKGCEALPALPSLDRWDVCAESLDDRANAVQSRTPLSFSSMELDFGHLLYSAVIHSSEKRLTTIVLPHTQDPVRVFVNGVHCGILRDTFGTSVQIALEEGENRIDLLVQHMGRFNFSFYLGEPKGIYGPVYMDGESEDVRQGWMTSDGSLLHLDQVNDGLQGRKLKKTFRKEEFDNYLLIGEIGEELWINQTKIDLGPYRVWFKIGAIDLSPHLQAGENTIEMVFRAAPLRRLEILKWKSAKEINGWRISAVNRPPLNGEWTEVNGSAPQGPAWYRCSFVKPQLPEQAQAKCKLRLTGLSKGALWVNSRNLGRYWQIGPQEDYKIPLEWLDETNELLLFDEEGRVPEFVELMWENVSFKR